MSIFSKINLNLTSDEIPEIIAFSKLSKSPIWAVSLGEIVVFFKENGIKSEKTVSNKNDRITKLEWNPSNLFLIIGFFSGAIGLYDFFDNKLKIVNNHKKEIIHINFNSSGSLMLACDKVGIVSFWRESNCLKKETFSAPITNSIFIKFKLKKDNKVKKLIPLIFTGDKLGNILYFQEKNWESTELFQAKGSIKSLMYHKDSQSIIIITSTLLFIQIQISSSTQITPTKKVKLSISSKIENLNILWMEPNMFSIVSNEEVIRIWNIENDDYYNLNYNELEQVEGKAIKSTYDHYSRNLFIGTSDGYLIAYRINSNFNNPNSENWKIYKTFEKFNSPILDIKNHSTGYVALLTNNSVSILLINELQSLVYEDRIFNQSNINKITISKYPFNEKKEIRFNDITIKIFDYFNNKILIYTGKNIEIYNIIKLDSIEKVNSFEVLGKYVFFSRVGIIVIEGYSVKIFDIEGRITHELNISLLEGEIVQYSKVKNFILLNTKKGYLKLIDLNKLDFDIKTENFPLSQIIKKAKYLKSIQISLDGKKVLMSTKSKNDNICLNIYIFDNKKLIEFEFDKEDERLKRINRIFWDCKDLMSFCIFGKSKNDSNVWISFFLSEKNKIFLNEYKTINEEYDNLIAFYSPFYILGIKTSIKYSLNTILSNKYANIDPENMNEIESLRNFNYYSTIGLIEKAYNSIKYMSKNHLWIDLFKLSVKNKRLDIAEISIGNMKFARAAQFLREEKKKNTDKITRLSTLCVQLNLIDEAIQLLEENKNYEKIIELYIILGEWKKAEELCKRTDRINLKLLYFKWAKYYESQGMLDESMDLYEKLESGVDNIFKMLLEKDEIKKWVDYSIRKDDNELYNKLGFYYLKKNDINKSNEFFKKSKNYKKIVENLLNINQVENAVEICRSTNDPGAYLKLSEYYELEDNMKECVQYLIDGKLYFKAMKILKGNNDDERYFSLALKAPFYAQNIAAKYFNEKGFNEKAIQLLINCKQYKKALDISMKNNLNEYINKLTILISESNSKTNSSDKLIKKGEYSQAFALMIAEKKFNESIELLKTYKFEIDYKQIEILMNHLENDSSSDKKEILTIFAKRLKQSGQFFKAHTIYCKISNLLKALKCLFKEGNTEKIINFANISRNKQICIETAEFLKSLEWKYQSPIYLNIIKMYSKSKCWEKISEFLLLCGNIELQDFNNIENCLKCLEESNNYINKIKDNENLLKRIEHNIEIVNYFENCINTENIQNLRELLNTNDLGDILLKGNIFSKIVLINVKNENFNEAYELFWEMKELNIKILSYFKMDDIKKILNIINKPIESLFDEEKKDENASEESEIYEEINESLE